jgi:hypothetical protein
MDYRYIPYGWGHAVVNLEDTLGLAIEFYTLLRELTQEQAGLLTTSPDQSFINKL